MHGNNTDNRERTKRKRGERDGLEDGVDMGKRWPCMAMLRREGLRRTAWCREGKVEEGARG